MPYITKAERREIRRSLDEGVLPRLDTAGQLNYFITTLADIYINDHFLNYQTLNDVIGALEGAKLELYRRVVGPYENKKINVNGDVFTRTALGE